MKEISLKDRHIALGAKMVEFAGYNMPLQYSGLIDEHLAVRNNVGIFDVSHMGEFMVRGLGAMEMIQFVTSNDVSKLFPGKVQYSCFPNDTGGIVDDLLVYHLGEEEYMLVVNAANIEKDWNWLQRHLREGVQMENISDETSLLAVQGPNAAKVLQSLTEIDLASMAYYTFEKGAFAGVDDVLVSATGYTGAGGFEIYFKNQDATAIFDAIMEAGEEHDLKPAGLAARDTLRLEMGFCLYGNDITDETSPLEAGLGWITKFDHPFVHSEALAQQKQEGVPRRLIAFEVEGRGIPRKGYSIVNGAGETIGEVTSGTMSPSLNKGIGLGYVHKSELESDLHVEIRSKQIPVKRVKLPFYKAS